MICKQLFIFKAILIHILIKNVFKFKKIGKSTYFVELTNLNNREGTESTVPTLYRPFILLKTLNTYRFFIKKSTAISR